MNTHSLSHNTWHNKSAQNQNAFVYTFFTLSSLSDAHEFSMLSKFHNYAECDPCGLHSV